MQILPIHRGGAQPLTPYWCPPSKEHGRERIRVISGKRDLANIKSGTQPVPKVTSSGDQLCWY
jgi:hypothetical protein